MLDAPAPALLRPQFTSPRVGAVMTTRAGGVSQGDFASLNLRAEVGDAPQDVARNRALLRGWIGRDSQRLNQVHGVAVHDMGDELVAPLPMADASVTASTSLACEVQTADCLPVLFAHRGGRAVGAAHAGWRGLAGGVLEATLARVCALAVAPPDEIEVWLGACIGPQAFEVGADVVQAFGGSAAAPGPRFQPRQEAGIAGKWWADLPGLARDRLALAGVQTLSGNDGSAPWCTLGNPSRYFSFRRSSRTGRMAALIWLHD